MFKYFLTFIIIFQNYYLFANDKLNTDMNLEKSNFTASSLENNKKIIKNPIIQRHLSNIYFGVYFSAGPLFSFNDHYSNDHWKIKDKRSYFYNAGLEGDFYLSSYASMNITWGFGALKFQRYLKDNLGVDSTVSYKKLFTNFNISSRFLFNDLFFLQTGVSFLFSLYQKYSVVQKPFSVVDRFTFNLRWQFGLGFSKSINLSSKIPQMLFNIGMFTYIPIAGKTISSNISLNNQSTNVESQRYMLEFLIGITFLLH